MCVSVKEIEGEACRPRDSVAATIAYNKSAVEKAEDKVGSGLVLRDSSIHSHTQFSDLVWWTVKQRLDAGQRLQMSEYSYIHIIKQTFVEFIFTNTLCFLINIGQYIILHMLADLDLILLL